MNRFNNTRSCKKIQSTKNKILKNSSILEQLITPRQWQSILELQGSEFRERLFPLMTTIWIFLTQVLNPDPSCRAAVAQYISTLKSKTCSLATGAYCQARKRLKEEVLRHLFFTHSQQLQSYIQELQDDGI